MTEPCRITEEQRLRLLEYLDERRSNAYIRLVLTGVLSLILFFPLMQTVSDLLGVPVLFFQPAGVTAALDTDGTELVFFGTLVLAVIWVCLAGSFVQGLRRGYQTVYGSNTPLERFRRGEYTCQSIVTAKITENPKNRHPFKLTDPFGAEYICPKYTDWRHAERGKPMIGVVLGEQYRYAVADTTLTEEPAYGAEKQEGI